jgi:HAD superfamily hydrolase (TIGR01490 family)
MDDGSVLSVAWIASFGGGMALCFERGPSAQSEESCAGGDLMRRKVEKLQEVEETKEEIKNVAAFFDLDGTLVPLPSLEWKFFRMLRYRKHIGIRSYFLWCVEALWQLPRGINQILHANKMYLGGISVGEKDLFKVPTFYPEAIERMVWHAERGHLIVIVSGTLELLGERAARALEAELGERGLATKICVCATRLEVKCGRYTGRILGEAIFGEAKARAVPRIAAEENLDLQRCFGYGDSVSDRWMLDAVGKPAAVNPSNDLARIARRNDWPVLTWGKEKTFTQRAQRAERTQRSDESENELHVARVKAGFRI